MLPRVGIELPAATITLYLFQKVKKVKWCMKQNSFEGTPLQHMSGWQHWLGIRLQTSFCHCW